MHSHYVHEALLAAHPCIPVPANCLSTRHRRTRLQGAVTALHWPAAVPQETAPLVPKINWNGSRAAHSLNRNIRPLLVDRQRGNRGRVLIVTPQPFYEDRGTPIAVRYVASALSDLGIKVDLLAFPVGETIRLEHMTLYRCANYLGLKRVPIGLSWRKLVLDASLWRTFRQLIAAQRYDMVHAVEEAAYMASILCPKYAQPFVYDMASCLPDAMQRNALLKCAPLRRVFRAMEQRVFSNASHIVCSAGLAPYVRERDPSASVSEWRFPAHSGPVAMGDVAALRAQLQIPQGRTVLLYSGNFAGYQGIDLLISAFARARRLRPELLLVCVGATDRDLASTRRLTDPDGHEHIRFLPRQPRDRILTYSAMADVLMLPRIGPDNIPLKLYDYMASGIPIVATRQNGHDGILNDQRAFLCAPTAESMADAIVRICEHPDEAALVGGEALRYAQQHFGWGGFVEFLRGVYGTAIAQRACLEVRQLQPAPIAALEPDMSSASRALSHVASAHSRY
jgi:glycosyltransferase involved in cell wall biosynthesis